MKKKSSVCCVCGRDIFTPLFSNTLGTQNTYKFCTLGCVDVAKMFVQIGEMKNDRLAEESRAELALAKERVNALILMMDYVSMSPVKRINIIYDALQLIAFPPRTDSSPPAAADKKGGGA